MSLDTEKRSIYSLISRRKSEFWGSLNRKSANDFASSVLPTPYIHKIIVSEQEHITTNNDSSSTHRGANHEEHAERPVVVAQARAGEADALGDGGDGLVLTH